MFESILIPLDGSDLAECALPYAESIAVGCKAKAIILVSVTEKVVGETSAPEAREVFTTGDTLTVAGDSGMVSVTFGKKQNQANRYLNRLAKNLVKSGIPVETQVLIGNPADEISYFAEKNDIELIVMSSHGRSGPSRWTHGSVAEKIFRASCVPILMVRAPGCTV